MVRLAAILVMLAAGVLAAIQPVVNAAMGKQVSAYGALTVSVLITAVLSIGLLVVSGSTSTLVSNLGEIRPWHALGGLAGVVIVGGSLFAVRHVGATGVTALLLATQLGVSVAIDRYGWFGVDRVQIDATKVAGIFLLLVGAALVLRD